MSKAALTFLPFQFWLMLWLMGYAHHNLNATPAHESQCYLPKPNIIYYMICFTEGDAWLEKPRIASSLFFA